MSYQSEMVFVCLKGLLKDHHLTYADLAERMGTTEASIKNMFYKRRLDLDRLDDICEALGMSMFDFMELAGQYQDGDFQFSEIQEAFFVDHPGHFAFFRALLFERKSLTQIAEEHDLPEAMIFRYVRDLEKLDLIEQRNQGHIVFHKKGRLVWRKGGPWMQKYYRHLTNQQAELMVEHANDDDYLVNFGMFSLLRADLDAFYRDIDQLLTSYKNLAYQQFIGMRHDENRIPVNWNFMVLPDCIDVDAAKIPQI